MSFPLSKLLAFKNSKNPYHAARVNMSRNAFSSSRSEKNIFFDVGIVVDIVVDSLGCPSWVHNTLTTVITRLVVDKSTDHAKPQ